MPAPLEYEAVLSHCWVHTPVCLQTGTFLRLEFPTAFLFSQNTPWGPTHIFTLLILRILLIASPRSSRDYSIGVAFSSVYFSVVHCFLHNKIWSFFFSCVNNRPASALLSLQCHNKVEPGRDLLSIGNITEAWLSLKLSNLKCVFPRGALLFYPSLS